MNTFFNPKVASAAWFSSSSLSLLLLFPAFIRAMTPNEGMATSDGIGRLWNMSNIIVDPEISRNGADNLSGMRFSDNGKYFLIVEEAVNSALVYCLEITRDPFDGTIKAFGNASDPILFRDRATDTTSRTTQLDNGFVQGPGGFDYVSIEEGNPRLLNLTYDANGKPSEYILESELFAPTNLNPRTGVAAFEVDPLSGNQVLDANGNPIPLITDVRAVNLATNGFYGIAFSNIATDPNTGRPMMLGVGESELYALPLIDDGNGYFDWDYDRIEFLCSFPPRVTSYTGELRVITRGEFKDDLLLAHYNTKTIEIIDIDSATGYPVGYDPLNPIYRHDVIALKTVAPPPFCPVSIWFNFTEAGYGEFDKPWGTVFDEDTGDLFVTENQSRSQTLLRIRGFAPGFDPVVLAASLQAVFEELTALLNLLNAPVRRGRELESPSASSSKKLRAHRKRGRRELSDKKTKSEGKGKGKGGSEMAFPTSDDLIASSIGTNGEFIASPEVLDAFALAVDPTDPAFAESLDAAEPTQELLDNVSTLKTFVTTLTQGAPAASPVAGKRDFLLCLLTKLENMSTPASAPDCIEPAEINI